VKPIEKDPLNLIIAGVGGQGNILASAVIAQAALREGLDATIGETYGVSQRGGSVMSHVRLTRGSSPGPLIPRGEGDILVGFEPLEALQVAMEFCNADTEVLCNPRPVYPIGVLAGEFTYPPVERIMDLLDRHTAGLVRLPATELAKEAGEIRAMNLVMVGAVAATGLLPLKLESYRAVMETLFQDRTLETNRKAFERGYEEVRSVAARK
jgi:indolepyruvate ferredoxin oxidoreductase beta subunit